MIEQQYEPPINMRWFQNQLNRLTRGTTIELRLEWAPRLFIAKTIDAEGYKRNYPKYPLRYGFFEQWHLGNHFYRDLGNGHRVGVGYQKQGGLVPSNILPSDIAVADFEYRSPSVEIFVIEQRLPDTQAKPIHEQKRRLAKAQLGFDLFGEFPPEGVWDWRYNIAEHRGVQQGGVEVPCCDTSDFYGVICEGVWREPDRKDLAQVTRAVEEWKSEHSREDRHLYIEQVVRDEVATTDRVKEFVLIDLMREGRELDALDEIAKTRSRVAMGTNAPQHRTAY